MFVKDNSVTNLLDLITGKSKIIGDKNLYNFK